MSAVSASSSSAANFLTPNANFVPVLVLDGGGVRGNLSIEVLKGIERYTGHPISRLFQISAGTSIGALIAAGLNVPDSSDPQTPRYTATQFGKIMRTNAIRIFPRGPLDFFRKVTHLGKGSLYSPEGIDAVSREIFGEKALLRHTLSDVLITATQLKLYSGDPALDELSTDGPTKKWSTKLFSTTTCNNKSHYNNLSLEDVCKASAAAPIYFTPRQLSGHPDKYYIDGGLLANSPGYLAYLYARERAPSSHIMMLSIGTGVHETLTTKKDLGSIGIQDAGDIISVMMNGTSNNADKQLSNEAEKNPTNLSYLRLQLSLPEEFSSMDNASEVNLQALSHFGKQMVKTNAIQIQLFCDKLMKALQIEKIGNHSIVDDS